MRTLIPQVSTRLAWTHFPKEDFQIGRALAAGQLTRTARRGFFSTLTRRAVRPVCSAPAACPRDQAADGKSVCTLFAAQSGFRTLSPPSPGGGASPGPAGALGSVPCPVHGRRKTAAQLYLAASVAHLTLLTPATPW